MKIKVYAMPFGRVGEFPVKAFHRFPEISENIRINFLQFPEFFLLSTDPNITDVLQREHHQVLAGNRSGVVKMLIFDL